MKEPQLIERKTTSVARVPLDLFTDQVSVGLSPVGRAVRVAAHAHARADTTQRVGGAMQPGVGWLLTSTATATLAHLTGFAEASVAGAIDELAARLAFVRSDAGVLGVVGWWSESARRATLRARLDRARRAAP